VADPRRPQLETIDLAALDGVTGGRVTQGKDDTAVLQAIAQLGELVKAATQSLAQNQSKGQEQFAQIAQEMMQRRSGGGGKSRAG
jgi:hypothetical protein